MDFVSRSGGEEFAVVLPETDQHQAFLFAEELLDKIRETSVAAGIESDARRRESRSSPITAATSSRSAAAATGRCTQPRHSAATER